MTERSPKVAARKGMEGNAPRTMAGCGPLRTQNGWVLFPRPLSVNVGKGFAFGFEMRRLRTEEVLQAIRLKTQKPNEINAATISSRQTEPPMTETIWRPWNGNQCDDDYDVRERHPA